MANIQTLDPSTSPLAYYGWELRRQREAANLKQGQLGAIIFCTGSLIGQIETARKVPTRDFSERLDAALGTGGLFSRLIGLVLRSQLPTWFQAYAEMESRATYISTYQSQMVYGLLQTEEYARAVLATGMPEDLDGLLAARMERQRILKRSSRRSPGSSWTRRCCPARSAGVGSCEANSPGCWSASAIVGCAFRCCPSRRVNMRAWPARSISCASRATRTSCTPRTSSPAT